MSDFKAKMHQIRFRLGLRPKPHWGSLQRSPDPLAGFEGLFLREGREEGRGGEGREKGGEAFLVMWPRRLSALNPPLLSAWELHRTERHGVQRCRWLWPSTLRNEEKPAQCSARGVRVVKNWHFCVIWYLHCALSLAAQCIVIGPVCVCNGRAGVVCLWVCYHDNSKLRALIFTKLGL